MLVLFHIETTPAYADSVFTVTITADTANSDCLLQEAIVAAHNDAAYNGCLPGSEDNIINMTALSRAITLLGYLPVITHTLQFKGLATNTLTIDGLNTYNAIDSTGSRVDIGVGYL